MKLPWRRRIIRDVGPTGLVRVWTIPFDPQATDDEDALVRHFRLFSRFDPITIAELMGTRLGSLLLGTVRYEGVTSVRGSLGKWADRVEAKPRRRRLAAFDDPPPPGFDDELEDFATAKRATPGPLSKEDFDDMMRGESELMRRVHWRLMNE